MMKVNLGFRLQTCFFFFNETPTLCLCSFVCHKRQNLHLLLQSECWHKFASFYHRILKKLRNFLFNADFFSLSIKTSIKFERHKLDGAHQMLTANGRWLFDLRGLTQGSKVTPEELCPAEPLWVPLDLSHWRRVSSRFSTEPSNRRK